MMKGTLPCPSCRAVSVEASWAVPGCTMCLESWENWTQYWLDVGKVGLMKSPASEPASPDYSESDELREEIEKLVKRAIANGVRDTLHDVYMKIASIGASAQSASEAFVQIQEMMWKKLVEADEEIRDD